MGENIGAAARAILNFGMTDLRLVAPRDGWPNDRATSLSAGAFEKMPPVQVFDTMQEAIADCHICMATTARSRDMVKPVQTAYAAANTSKDVFEQGQRIGLIFGPEQSGLTNDHIALCQSLITIPTNPEFSSINLGQGVLLVAYEFWQALNDLRSGTTPLHQNSPPVTQDKMEEFLTRLDNELDAHDFFKADGLKPTMQRSIRNIFSRNDLSDQEVRTLHGIVSALTKPPREN